MLFDFSYLKHIAINPIFKNLTQTFLQTWWYLQWHIFYTTWWCCHFRGWWNNDL